MIDRPMNRCKVEIYMQELWFLCMTCRLNVVYHNFWRNFPLIICNAISCPLYILIAIKGISTKLHTFVNRVMVLVHDTLSNCAVEVCEVSTK